MKLKGKIAVVAGASGGIGREMSRALAKQGVEVVLVARKKQILSALKEDIEDKGGKAHIFTAELTDSRDVSKLSSTLKTQFKQVDLLFHCIGVGVYKKLADISVEDWQSSLDSNVTSVFFLSRSLLPLLRKSKKSYVLAMGSGMGKVAVAGRAPYCASKFALRGLMLSLAKEFERSKIHFVLLTLGSVMTKFGPLSIEDKKKKEEKGKKYLDPVWLAHYLVTKIKHDTLERETSIYPKHYYEESKKGKT